MNEPKYKELTTNNRQTAFFLLWQGQENGRPAHGQIQEVADLMSVHRATISNLWRAVKKKMDDHISSHPDEPVDIESLLLDRSFYESNRKQTGRKKKWDVEALKEEVRTNVRLTDRQNLSLLSKNIGVPYSSLHRMLRTGHFRRHTSALKPHLTEENKVARVAYALDEIDMATLVGGGGVVQFKDMYDRVDIDEKWFYQTEDGKRYILIGSEDEPDDQEAAPHRRVRHKNHITKVMFLCAQARPRWDAHRNQYWDGKIGLWPIGEWVEARRTSANRPAGTLVWKDETITKAKYRQLLLQKVFPAIIEKWPATDWNRETCIIRVQQDGAKSHLDPDDQQLQEGLQELGIQNKVLLYTQPANSPDVNINDLGFFRALQSLYYRSTPGNAGEIIQCVQAAYNDYDSRKINRIWLSLMGCLNEIIKHHGDNDYKIPHMGKDRLERIGQLPITIPVCDDGVELLNAAVLND